MLTWLLIRVLTLTFLLCHVVFLSLYIERLVGADLRL
jgi:hypothetical protein